MKYCSNCGSEIGENQDVCLKCGNVVNKPEFRKEQNTFVEDDSNGALFGVLSFCFPIVGIILFFVWKNDRPKVAKIALICGLVGFVINLIITIATLPSLGNL